MRFSATICCDGVVVALKAEMGLRNHDGRSISLAEVTMAARRGGRATRLPR